MQMVDCKIFKNVIVIITQHSGLNQWDSWTCCFRQILPNVSVDSEGEALRIQVFGLLCCIIYVLLCFYISTLSQYVCCKPLASFNTLYLKDKSENQIHMGGGVQHSEVSLLCTGLAPGSMLIKDYVWCWWLNLLWLHLKQQSYPLSIVMA